MRLAKRDGLARRRPWEATGVVSAFLALLCLSAFSHAPASGDEILYSSLLTGDQEVPPAATPGIGGGQFRIDTVANTVTYHIAFGGLTSAETMGHIHGPANPGTNGGVLHTLPLGNPKTGTWNYNEGEEADILAGRTYVNLHSTNFPAGELRGQIVPLNSFLDGEQTTPPTGSQATGWGVFTIDVAANNLNYYISYSGLSSEETAAHIHGFAGYGSGGGVLHPLPSGNPKVGTWNYPEGIDSRILEGVTYVNIHTVDFPTGEIRGQIVPVVAPIDGSQEVPPSGSPGAGVGLIAIDTTNDMLGYDIAFTDLSGTETNAHIHGFAPPGVNAGVLHQLPLGPRKLGVWNYDAGDEDSILDGLTYINIHSSANPGGEIRGQIQGFGPIPVSSVSDPATPRVFNIPSNEPNPFGATTAIRFRLGEDGDVRLQVFDSRGRFVRTLLERMMTAGSHSVLWDGRSASGEPVANGVYLYRLESAGERASGRMTILR